MKAAPLLRTKSFSFASEKETGNIEYVSAHTIFNNVNYM
jgi:hypothetical protein